MTPKEKSYLEALTWTLTTRQWLALSTLFGEPFPLTIGEKRKMLERCVEAMKKERRCEA